MEILNRIIGLIFRFYRVFISPAFQVGFGIQCRYEESCSCYMERALREKGIIKGFIAGTRRILTCWGAFGKNRSAHG